MVDVVMTPAGMSYYGEQHSRRKLQRLAHGDFTIFAHKHSIASLSPAEKSAHRHKYDAIRRERATEELRRKTKRRTQRGDLESGATGA